MNFIIRWHICREPKPVIKAQSATQKTEPQARTTQHLFNLHNLYEDNF